MNQSKIIVIAEDSPTQAASLNYTLENHGYSVIVAKDGEDALEKVRKHKPSLVLSDIFMPKMNGYELSKVIKSDEELKDIPVILLTSISKSEDLIESLASGADSFISKPYNEKFLISYIEKTLALITLNGKHNSEIDLAVSFDGEIRSVKLDPKKMLTMLTSSCDSILIHNNDLLHTQAELYAINENLKETDQKLREKTEVLIKLNQELEEKAQKIEKQNDVFINIVGRNQTGILVVDKKGIIKFVNPAAEQIFKRESGKLIGEEFGFLIENDKKVEIDIWQGNNTSGIGEMSSTITEWEGESAFLISINDITNLKTIEDNLKQLSVELQEKNVDLESYAHTVAHDLKNPVGAIMGFSEMIFEEKDLTIEEIREYGGIIYQSGSQLLNIINELLLFASLQKTEIDFMELDMGKIVKNSIERTIPKNELVNVEITFPDKWLNAIGYDAWIEEVWKNYISNALKYGGNPLKIEFGCNPFPSEGNTMSIKYWIKDFGPGISEENQKLLFNKFKRLNQAKATGHGLGLSIVRRIIKKLGGKTGVESHVGKGSTFYFTLPSVLTSEFIGFQPEINEVSTKTQDLKTLIVENDMASDIFLGVIVEKFSKEVIHVNNGADAIQMCKENDNIDLILMDIAMPEINGNEAARAIREFNKEVIIIAQTAFSLSNAREEAIEAGCNDYISKPINVDKLIEIIEKQIRNKKLKTSQ